MCVCRFFIVLRHHHIVSFYLWIHDFCGTLFFTYVFCSNASFSFPPLHPFSYLLFFHQFNSFRLRARFYCIPLITPVVSLICPIVKIFLPLSSPHPRLLFAFPSILNTSIQHNIIPPLFFFMFYPFYISYPFSTMVKMPPFCIVTISWRGRRIYCIKKREGIVVTCILTLLFLFLSLSQNKVK